MSDQYSTDDRKGLINRDKISDGKRILPRDGDNIYDQQPNKKKRNIIIGVVVGILILVGIILAIVFSKKSSDDSGDDPGPSPIPPTPPFVPSGFNPYYINTDTIQSDVDYFKGNIIYNDTYVHAFNKNLKMKQTDDKIGVNATQIPLGINNQLSKNISFEFGQADYKVGFVNIIDQTQASWSIPSTAVPKSQAQRTMRLDMNNFQFSANPFYFNYSSTRGSFDTLITTNNQTLYVTQKYIQMDIQLPSQRVFGFGERNREFQLSEGTWTMWSNGQQTPYDDGTGSLQTYGVHPFALIQCKQKSEFIGIFFRNSNAQSPILTYNDDNVTSTLSYITTGGALEIYFFTKGTAKQIIASYQRVIGFPYLPPFWALGWHSSSKMLSTLQMVKDNVQKYNESGIPLESVWLDNYYMKNLQHFTVDDVAFKGLLDFSQNVLHKNGMKLIPVVQAGLSFNDKGDQYVSEALTLNTLIMNLDNLILESKGLQNSTVFLDFFNSQSQTVWGEGLQELYSLMNFDGLWLDMNEPTTFCNGSYPICNSNNVSTKYNLTDKVYQKIQDLQVKFLQSQSKLEDINTSWYTSKFSQDQNSTFYLPFIPSNKWNLDNMTLSLNASNSRTNYTQYNTHSLFGHMQSQATYNYLSSDNSSLNSTFYDKRLFLQSRSTFAGSGKYVSHSLGENHRTFKDMKLSIAGIMNFNMFGIPLVGPNICGSINTDSTEDEYELCGRWIQLSTFYPFARINGDNFTNGQLLEPHNLNETYQKMAKSSIIERFKYMTFMYTCLFQASQEGKTCFDPLLFHYPTIDNAFNDIESTFIVGDALKVSPVLQPMNGQTEYSVFFPQGNWVSMKNLNDVVVVENPNGENVTLTAPDDTVNVHLRPGYIVPIQNNTINGFNVNLTSQLQKNPISLIINRDTNYHAEGRLMINNDNNISSINSQSYEYYEFQLFGNSLNVINMNPSSSVYQETDLQQIQIANASDLKNVTSACSINKDNRNAVKLDFTWADNILSLMYNKDDLSQHIKIAGLRQIVFATDNQLSLCQLSSNWTSNLPSYYKWDTLLDLTKVESSATLKSSVSYLKDLTLTARVLKNNILNIYWTFANDQSLERTPFEVPTNIINVNKSELSDQILSNFILQLNQTDKPFLQIVNKQNNEILDINSLVLTEYFNFINSNVIVSEKANFKGIMGLSERVSNDVFLGTGVYSLWSRDTANPVETGEAPGNNLYGTHPFYMAKSTDNSWFGVFTNLANAQDWYVNNNADTGIVGLTSYATGGVVDMYIMYGQDPNEVTVQYQSIVGNPVLTPQWALGWNQCKWGYKSTQELKDVVNNYSANGIPLDTIWSDIDYLANYRDFHYDDENGFGDLPDYVNITLHSENMHWIPIIDAGVAQRQGYDAYDDGISSNIFIKSFDNQTVFTGQVWPDDAVFPDFFNKDAETYWQTYIGKLQAKIPFDGLWLDMNEASNFCDGACYADQIAPSPVQYKLPYLPSQRNLETKSIALDSIHSGGILELDAHSLFGTMQSRAAHLWFQSNNRRTLIIQRSAFAGLGKFASRWLGDNWSLNEYMGYSVTGIMMHNILGITLAGSDICGFIGDTNPELCARWHVVGSFYPFSRNHNNWGQIPQEPYLFTGIYQGTIKYSDIMKQAIYNKYQMVRYYYTQMGLISQNGGALYKPLFFEFPNDINAYQNQTDNIMLGKALKLSVLTTTIAQNQTVFYFPQGTWCQVFNTSAHADSCITAPAEGSKLILSTLAYQFYVHLREGHIVPMQNASYLKIQTTADLQQKPVDFHIHPSLNSDTKNYEASGVYLNDDGLVLDYEGKQNIYQLSYSHTDNSLLTLTPTLTKSAFKVDGQVINMNDALGRVEIYNAQTLTLTADYTVSASLVNNTQHKFNNIAKFNVSSQRLQFEVDSGVQINLPELVKLEFTKSA